MVFSITLLYIVNFSLNTFSYFIFNLNNLDIKYTHSSGIPNAIFNLILFVKKKVMPAAGVEPATSRSSVLRSAS